MHFTFIIGIFQFIPQRYVNAKGVSGFAQTKKIPVKISSTGIRPPIWQVKVYIITKVCKFKMFTCIIIT
jgi:hypothetical protein